METQDNGFLLVIDGVRKEKERLTAANLLRVIPGPFLPLPAVHLLSWLHSLSFGLQSRTAERKESIS